MLTAAAQPAADGPDFTPCLQEPTVICLTDEYRRLVAPVLDRGESIGWENFQRLVELGKLDLARDAALAINVADDFSRSTRPSIRALDRRNNLQITRELALVEVMNADLERQDFAAAQDVLALTSGIGRIRGVIEYHAALITAGYSGLEAYPAARANLDLVLRETFRDVSARRWFNGAGYSKIGEELSIPAATAMARIGDVDHALAVAIAQNRAQGSGLPSAIRSMAQRLLELGDTGTVRGLADRMRKDIDRYHDLDHWTTVLAELAGFETRQGNIEKAHELFTQIAAGFAEHRQSPDRDKLLLALVTPEFVRAAPEIARELVYETEVLNSATRREAENRFALALKIKGDDARLLEALRTNGMTRIATSEDSAIRESIAVALVRQNRVLEALELLRAGSSVTARREVVELLIQQDALGDVRMLLEPKDMPGLAVRLLELGRRDDARMVLEDCWSMPEAARPLIAELVSATLEALARDDTATLIETVADRTQREQAWVLLGDALVDRGDLAAAQAAYDKANLTQEQSARVQQYFDAVRQGRPAAVARLFATETIRDDAGMFLPSDMRVYPSRIPGLTPLAFFRGITRVDYWNTLPDEEKRELLLRVAVALQRKTH